jgi:hypothetical protein
MFSYLFEKLGLSPEHRKVLKATEIDYDRGPGTVLRDFDALLAYIRERDVRTTAGHQLPLRALPELNARLARPIQHGLQRPQQKSYPHLHGLYLLARASGLAYVDESGGKPRLVVDDEVYRAWERLNPAERYGNLLETWFLRGWSEIVGDQDSRWRRIPENFERSVAFFLSIPEAGLPVAGDRRVEEWLAYRPGWHNLGLLDLFGFVDVRPAPPEPGNGWRIERVARTSFGEAMLAALLPELFGEAGGFSALEDEEPIPTGALQSVLRPYFPEWKNNLALPGWSFREGTHIFKVSLLDIWLRIAIPAGAVLDELAWDILDAVDFDHDHLYAFEYRNRFGVTERVHHPYMDEAPWTSEVSVGDLPLPVGGRMTFVYDFGDWWEFDVALEQVDPGMALEEATILESHGEPPEQYPTWEDDEMEESAWDEVAWDEDEDQGD